ncbi:hypothetical protein [Shigella phage ESh32]|nr:hypothetical protein [Shigella phage ESh32]
MNIGAMHFRRVAAPLANFPFYSPNYFLYQ